MQGIKFWAVWGLCAAGSVLAQDDVAEASLLVDAVRNLEVAKPAIHCEDRAELQALSRELLDGSFGPAAAPSADFVYYSAKQGSLTLCHKGKAIAGLLGGYASEDRLVYVAQAERDGERSAFPVLGDWNQDGKPEFVVYDGSCVEGPCLGAFHIVGLEGNKLRQLYDVKAENLKWHEESGRQALVAESMCFDYDFEAIFSYISVLEVNKKGLRLVPYPEIRKLYPALLAQYQQETQADNIWQKLIVKAYTGVSRELLEKNYRVQIARTGGEFAGYCDPMQILDRIAGESLQ